MPTVIFLRDLKRITSVKYFYWRRFLFVGCIFVFFCFATTSNYSNTAVGVHLLSFIAWVTYVLLVYSASSSAATTIGDEIEKKTLGLLVITRLSYRNVILGKYIQQLFITCLNAIAPLPIFLFCISLGGVSLQQIACLLLSLLSTLMIAIAIGIFCSTLFNSKSSPSTAVTLMIVYEIVTYTTLPFSCFAAVHSSLEGLDFSHCYYNFAAQCISSAVLVILAIRFLPFMYLLRNKVGMEVKFNKSLRNILPATKKAKRGKAIGHQITGNPIAWRDFHMLHGGTIGTIKKIVFLVIVGFLIATLFYGSSLAHLAQGVLSSLGIPMLLFLMTLINSGLRSFSKEMGEKSWQILLTTRLSNKEIVYGKMLGAFRSAQVFLIVYLVIATCCILLIYSSVSINFGELAVLASYILWFISYAFNLFCCALFCSFYYKNYRRASNYFVLYFIIWHIMSGMIFSGNHVFWQGSTGAIVNMIFAFIHMFMALTFFYYIVCNLRLRIDFAD